jgi:filamentous hemagglutinin family protein
MPKTPTTDYQDPSSVKLSNISKPGLLIKLLIILGVFPLLSIPVSAQVNASTQIIYEGGGVPTLDTTKVYTIPIANGEAKGANLFHGFREFGLKAGETVNFQSSSSIANIFGRVTNPQPSLIDGKIQVTGGNSNLYLMNPAGIVFGPNAKLDVNGAFTATTARAIGFGNGNWFNAVGTNNYNALTGTPQGLAFTNTPGSIFSAATLNNQQPKQSITLVGGTVIITGDIITQAGKISIATVQGGKYVQIKSDGSILSLKLPTDAQNINSEATALVPSSLATLLTNSGVAPVDLKVNIEANGVVKLISANPQVSNRPILTGDIVTKTLDSSGNTTTQIAEADKPNISLNTQAGDIIVNTINTGSSFFDNISFGGDVNVNAGGLFRVTDASSDKTSIFTGGNRDASIPDSSLYGGKINITHQGNSFVIGGKTEITTTTAPTILTITTTLTDPFSFPEGASGTRGGIVTRNTNGTFGVVFRDGVFVDQSGLTPDGFGITSIPRTVSGQASNLDVQVSRPKPKDDCIAPISTTIATSATVDQNRSIRSSASSATTTCPSNVDNGKILQISNSSR